MKTKQIKVSAADKLKMILLSVFSVAIVLSIVFVLKYYFTINCIA